MTPKFPSEQTEPLGTFAKVFRVHSPAPTENTPPSEAPWDPGVQHLLLGRELGGRSGCSDAPQQGGSAGCWRRDWQLGDGPQQAARGWGAHSEGGCQETWEGALFWAWSGWGRQRHHRGGVRSQTSSARGLTPASKGWGLGQKRNWGGKCRSEGQAICCSQTQT